MDEAEITKRFSHHPPGNADVVVKHEHVRNRGYGYPHAPDCLVPALEEVLVADEWGKP